MSYRVNMNTCSICNKNMAMEGFLFKSYIVCICKNCVFRWLDPQLTDQVLSEIYSDQYFLDEGDAEITEIDNKLKRATSGSYLKKLVAKDLSSSKELSLLKIGLGMGNFSLEAQSKGFKASDLDMTDYLVGFAGSRFNLSNIHKEYNVTVNIKNIVSKGLDCYELITLL